MYRKLKTILYHGTITEIQHIDVTLGLFLEPNEYLCQAYDKEIDSGNDALYEYINNV